MLARLLLRACMYAIIIYIFYPSIFFVSIVKLLRNFQKFFDRWWGVPPTSPLVAFLS